MPPRPTRPRSAPGRRPGKENALQTMGQPVERKEYEGAGAKQRPGTGASASRRRREIVSEYMRARVDPVMRDLVTHLLVGGGVLECRASARVE